MDRMDFNHAVARLRVLETKLLDKNKVERMVDSNSAREALKVLQETQYGESVKSEDPHEFEDALKLELINLYKFAYEISPEKSIVDVMSLKYDYHNIRVLEKQKILDAIGTKGSKADLSSLLIPVGTESLEDLKNLILSGDDKVKVHKNIIKAVKEIEKCYSDTKDPQFVDITADRLMYADLADRAENTDIPYIKAYVKSYIDVVNIMTMLRVKKQNKDVKFLENVLLSGGTIDKSIFIQYVYDSLEAFIKAIKNTEYSKVIVHVLDEYNRTGNISALDVYFDNYIIHGSNEARKINFGPEPLVSYIIAREMEIKIIRIIMVGKINNVSPDVIRERLRDLNA